MEKEKPMVDAGFSIVRSESNCYNPTVFKQFSSNGAQLQYQSQSRKIRISIEEVHSFIAAERHRHAALMQEERPVILVPIQENFIQEQPLVQRNRGDQQYTRRSFFREAARTSTKFALGIAAASLLGLSLESPKSVEAVTLPDSLWYWRGQYIRAFINNMHGIIEVNGKPQVDPNDIGPHYNFRIQGLQGGGDFQNWHIQYAEDDNYYYYKVFDSVNQMHLNPEGVYKFSKSVYPSMEAASQEGAMWSITTDLAELNSLPTGDVGSMAAELQSPAVNGGNILSLGEMLIPLAQETITVGADVVEQLGGSILTCV